jgi:DNA-dependent RNA polymerase auxiliary subunit epsilon
MTVTIQEGIDASPLREAIYETLRVSMEAEAAHRRKLHQARMELIRKGGGVGLSPRPAEQGSLFE